MCFLHLLLYLISIFIIFMLYKKLKLITSFLMRIFVNTGQVGIASPGLGINYAFKHVVLSYFNTVGVLSRVISRISYSKRE